MSEQVQTAVIEMAPPGPFREFWGYFSENRGALIGFYFILAIAAISRNKINYYIFFKAHYSHTKNSYILN